VLGKTKMSADAYAVANSAPLRKPVKYASGKDFANALEYGPWPTTNS
jgi:hypothetical protein